MVKYIKSSSRPTKPVTNWEDLPYGKDAVFLPDDSYTDAFTIIYVNEDANDGNGSFEIEDIDADGILKAYEQMKAENRTAKDVFLDILPNMYNGKWGYVDNGSDIPQMQAEFDACVKNFYKADFIESIDGDYEDELQFLVDWAKTRV